MKTRLIVLVLATLVSARAEEVKEMALRSLPFLKQQGIQWIEKRQCASCHQVPSMLWSLNRAAQTGLEQDNAESREWTPWAADWRHWNKTGDKDGVDAVSAGNIDTMAFLLLGRDATATPEPAWTAEFRAQILKNQQPDGSWKAGGQLPLGKRPARETAEVTTMWALLALRSYADGAAPQEVEKSAGDFLAGAQPGQSVEWHAARLLLDPGNAGLRGALLNLQRDDGGWGWLAGEPADAFGTGLALYALAKSGLPEDHDARRRAVAFLKATQAPDGSWPVPSTRAKDKNKINKTATYWGTAWAVIALLEPAAAGAGEADLPFEVKD